MTDRSDDDRLGAAQIREAFREFFVGQGHATPPPASLVPAGDPSVLFTTAGMQQFKPLYLGVESSPAGRLTTCQRCFRTSDIENVGKTARHLTFFEMLGNFSIGDYFKAEAIDWALRFSMQLAVDFDRVKVSVFGGDEQVPADEEAIGLWKAQGFGDDRIVHLGRKDNFWGPAGPTGPCGPCSELYYDMGAELGCGRADCGPGCDCDRWMEYWNLVFVQYEMDEGGGLMSLPAKSIDTGLGLERVTAVHQGVATVYETDLLWPLIELGERLSGVSYAEGDDARRALRTMAEHARGVAFLVMDGVMPGNEGRDYVLRRIVRRAVQQGVSLGVEAPFLAALCERVIETMRGAYPELETGRATILAVAGDEETRFRRTLEQGTQILDEALRRARSAGEELSPEVAFELHDTYGFPFDLTREIVQDAGMAVDEDGFERLMTDQRERARLAQRGGEAGPGEVETFQRQTAERPTTFVGYEKLEVSTVIRACRRLADGRVAVKLEESPFYAEGGGQVADGGWVHTESGKLEVDEVIRFEDDQVIVAHLTEGDVAEGERAKAMVNAVRRHHTACNHTATHLLHNALRIVVGDDVRQAGSMVRPEKLRFDYKTRRSPTPEELRQIEDLVNRRIVENHSVRPFVTTREYAAEIGALAFFEDKYGEFVRVLEIDEFSRELCGGTHVSTTSQIGACKIVSSQAVGANTRRLEAVTSQVALQHYRDTERRLADLAEELGVAAPRFEAAVRRQRDEVAELREQLKRVASGEVRGTLEALLESSQSLGGTEFVAASPAIAKPEELLVLADAVRERHPDGIVVLAGESEGRAAIVVSVGDGAVGKGAHANDIIRTMLPAVDGKGGGRPTLARGGGPNVAGIQAAVEAASLKVREILGP